MKFLYVSEDQKRIILKEGDDLTIFNLVGESEFLPEKKRPTVTKEKRRTNLTDEQKDEIWRKYTEGTEAKDLAKEYDISVATIYNLKKKMEGVTPGVQEPHKPNQSVNLYNCGDCDFRFVSKKKLEDVKCNMKPGCTNKKIKQLERNG